MSRVLELTIGDGHVYQVRVDERGFILATACKGRWAMTTATTGSNWLDSQLQRAANIVLETEAHNRDLAFGSR